ncbi:hypothetical protein [Variovorax sp. PAMC 28711]|uniref:hypothetical protein n=1 Tax=Variovorax sp. PAMC 28711 TaxID=1795631 RepID=UPI000ACAFAE8|nr:hypothetical protein [Variovorax sp. PAMC 28711]
MASKMSNPPKKRRVNPQKLARRKGYAAQRLRGRRAAQIAVDRWDNEGGAGPGGRPQAADVP